MNEQEFSSVMFWWVSQKGTCMAALGVRWNPVKRTSLCMSCGQYLPDGTDWSDHALKPETFAEWRLWKDWDDERRKAGARASPGTPPANDSPRS